MGTPLFPDAVVSALRPKPAAAATIPAVPANGIAPPSVISKVLPEYTEEARASKIEGAVILSVVIGTDGEAQEVQIVNSLDPGLDQKAIEAAKKWVFRHGMNNGVPVRTRQDRGHLQARCAPGHPTLSMRAFRHTGLGWFALFAFCTAATTSGCHRENPPLPAATLITPDTLNPLAANVDPWVAKNRVLVISDIAQRAR